ncbi:MAG: dipeptidase [Ginsengibacter sp.]
MHRTSFLFFIISAFSFITQAQSKVDKLIFIDTHNDVISKQMITGADLAKEQPETDLDLPKAKRGMLAAQVFSIWCDETYGNGRAYAWANREIDSLNALIKRNPEKMALVTDYKGLRKAIKKNKLAALIGVEGGHMIEDRIDYIDSLYKRGMRYLTLTWNNSTTWATSAKDEVTKKDSLPFTGLTAKGKQIVSHLNELGVMVDISHVGEKTFYDVLSVAAKPVIASHSCAYALCAHRRNLKDDQLKAVAKNGGVVFVNFYSQFLDSSYEKKVMPFLTAHKHETDSLIIIFKDPDLATIHLFHLYQKETDAFRPPLSLLIKHIDYMVKLMGIDHVGIGSDFDGAESFPLQLNDVSNYPLITTALQKLGYTIPDIKKITSENFIRVLKANEKKL